MSRSIEQLREADTERTGRNVRVVAVDLSFGHVFTLVFKVWMSLAILAVPVFIVWLLIGTP